jgi:eukaryotic-like serine/threonine-protein kinase
MERIAHYRLIRRLGSGGMGHVYLAADEHLGRTVALKVLASEHASDPSRLQRFEREARAASSLIHPNIAQVYEAGGDAAGRYIAMELVEGETLEQRIAREEIPIAEIVRIGSELVEAVAEAHAHGIIHRDIKSSNVMLTRNGRVKMLDFGIARMESPADGDTDTQWRTVTGQVVGTPPYMSPEQALGRPIDARSDIFSIGVVLYEMVARRLPFHGATAAETLQRILNDTPDPIARFNYRLPLELERIIRKCLEKRPERRYQSADDLAVDFRNLARDLAAGPVAIAEPREISQRTGRRRLVALLVPLLLVAGVVALRYFNERRASPLGQIRSVAVLPFAVESGSSVDHYFTEGLTENVISALSQHRDLRVMNRATVFQFASANDSPLTWARKLKVDAYVTANVRSDGTRPLAATAELVRSADGSVIAMQKFSRPSSEAGILHRDITTMVVAALGLPEAPQSRGYGSNNSEAYSSYLQGRHYWQQRSETGLREAIRLFSAAVELDPDYAPAWAALAESHSILERYAGTPVAESKVRARTAARRALNLDATLPEAHVAHASCLEMFDWDWDGAEAAYRRAIELGPSYSTAHHWLAMLLSRLGRHSEAIASIETARRLDPLNPLIGAAAANVHYYAGDFPTAAQEAREVLAIEPSSALARLQLGLALTFAGDHILAAEELQRVVSETATTPAIHVQALAALAVNAAHRDNPAAARRIADRLEASPKSHLFGYAIAAIHAALGEDDSAFLWLGHALDASSFWLSLSVVEPAFRSIRSDGRFDELVDKVGLPRVESAAGAPDA